MSRAELRRDLLALLLLFLLPLLWFGPVIFGDQTLLPADNIYQYQPWQSYAAAQGTKTPHNALLSDLVLENYPWKLLIRKPWRKGELPSVEPLPLHGRALPGRGPTLGPLPVQPRLLCAAAGTRPMASSPG